MYNARPIFLGRAQTGTLHTCCVYMMHAIERCCLYHADYTIEIDRRTLHKHPQWSRLSHNNMLKEGTSSTAQQQQQHCTVQRALQKLLCRVIQQRHTLCTLSWHTAADTTHTLSCNAYTQPLGWNEDHIVLKILQQLQQQQAVHRSQAAGWGHTHTHTTIATHTHTDALTHPTARSLHSRFQALAAIITRQQQPQRPAP